MGAAHLEGAEAGGYAVHGRRYLRQRCSTESSPAEAAAMGGGGRWRKAVRQVGGDESRLLSSTCMAIDAAFV
jgi:hypothetical protein